MGECSCRKIIPYLLFHGSATDVQQDGAGLITWLHKALIPRAKVEDERRWVERAESGRTYLFEKVS